MENNELLVSLKNITKIYGTHKVLDNVSFDLRKGEIHCLVGENGAGKSTLIKILSGAISPESGEVYISGQKVPFMTPRKAIELGISTVYQDAELVESLTVADNIFLGDEQSASIPFVVDKNAQFKKAQEIIDTLHMNLPVDALVEDLSVSQKQMLEIVKALYRDSKIIIMDEPTSSLGLEEKKALVNIIRNLKQRGIGIIYISHYLEEIFMIGDRVTILKDGKLVNTYEVAAVDMETVIRGMVGREASAFYHRKKIPLGPIQVEVQNLSKKGVIHPVSFEVRKGEILGIGGLVGSGRSELVGLIFGIQQPDSGKVIIKGKEVTIQNPRDAIRAGIGLITEDRRKLGLFTGRNLVENISLVHNDVFKGFIIDRNEEKDLSNQMVNELSIATSDINQLVEELSGGNQQKVVIARWLLDDAILCIFDEPTKGVDIGAKQQIYELMLELAEKGKSIIMVSSDMPELLSLSDRIIVMREGRIVEILDNHQIKEEDLIKKFMGVEGKG
ncbi:MAG: sugar ABC transporter ATP-binding protein [Candidatus Atribacteria bacterium]|nr:sugar ABC transporter ATP-binding protein [Candidatus Atribacteria bacterium]